MKLIDCHRHCSRKEEDFINLEQSALKGNMEKIILFGHNGLNQNGFDDVVWEWYKRRPDLIIPFACEFTFKQGDVEYVEKSLQKGFYGIGEILIGHEGAREKTYFNQQYDDDICIDVFNKAGEYNAPVLVHCNEKCTDGLLNSIAKCSKTTFIWAHIGFEFSNGFDGPMRDVEQIRGFLQKYDNLYFDTSFWKKSALCMKQDDYLELMEEFSERFIFGLDMTNDYVNSQGEYLPNHFIALEKLSEKAKENIFYNNMKKIINEREKVDKC